MMQQLKIVRQISCPVRFNSSITIESISNDFELLQNTRGFPLYTEQNGYFDQFYFNFSFNCLSISIIEGKGSPFSILFIALLIFSSCLL